MICNNPMGETPENLVALLAQTISQLSRDTKILVSVTFVNNNYLNAPVNHFEGLHEEEYYGK